MAQNRYSVTAFLTSPLVSTKNLHGHLVCAGFYCREGTLRRTACAAPRYALDSESGVQVMELLRGIAQDKLVIMVTHNDLLAGFIPSRIASKKDPVTCLREE